MARRNSDLHRYEEIMQSILDRIHSGRLRVGDKLPSVRLYAQEQGVSTATILQAYYELAEQDIIEARPQSGYYVLPTSHALRNLPPEPAMKQFQPRPADVNVIDLVEDLLNASQFQSFAPLGAALPSPDLFPLEKIAKALAGAARATQHLAGNHEQALGNYNLRRLIALHSREWSNSEWARKHGITHRQDHCFSADECIITHGATEAIHVCLRAIAKPGDTIAVESPCYFGILRIIEGLGMKSLEVPTDPRTGIALDVLESLMKKKRLRAVIVTPNFSNPLGSLMPDEAKYRLAQLASEYAVPVIEDDVYGDLHFGLHRPCTVQSFDMAGLVMLCSSFSKSLTPSLRVGFVCAGKFHAKVLQQKIATSLSTALVPQVAVADIIQSGGYTAHLRRMRQALARQISAMQSAISTYFPDGTKVTRPEGGFVMWVELPAINGRFPSAVKLHKVALEHKISIAPGPIFSHNPEYRHHFRVNCGYPWSPAIEAAVELLGQELVQQSV